MVTDLVMRGTMEQDKSEKNRKSDAIFIVLFLITTSLYGFIVYCLFLILFGEFDQSSGVMLLSFLCGLPISLGSLTASVLKLYTKNSPSMIYVYCFLPIIATVILSAVFLGEGVICIIMALPIFIIGITIGAALGSSLVKYQKLRSKKYVSVIALAPLVLGFYEQNINPVHSLQTLEREVFIESPASSIWPIILSPSDIEEVELSDGFVYKIGAPYPVSAITEKPEVGGIRHSVWQKGVTFDEEITAIKEHEYIEWVYHFEDDSFPPGSLDDHIKIGGTYFDLLKTSYSLQPEKSGTILKLKIDYRVSTNFNWYANLWGDFIIGNTAETLLNFYKTRSENN